MRIYQPELDQQRMKIERVYGYFQHQGKGIVIRMVLEGMVYSDGSTRSGHPKFCIFVGYDNLSGEAKFVVFNSKEVFPNGGSSKKKIIRDFQLSVHPSEYAFLDHESFINCMAVFSVPLVTVLRLMALSQREQARYLGELSKADTDRVLETIARCPTVTPRDAKWSHEPLKLPPREKVLNLMMKRRI